MGIFDGILLMTDLDGTLFDRGTVSRENCEAIAYFQDEGGLFSVASGRAPDWLSKWSTRFVPNTWSATFNGAILCDATGQEILYDCPAPPDVVDRGMEVLAACPNAEQIYFCCVNEDYYIVKQGEAIDLARIPKSIYKCLLRVPSADSDAYVQRVRQMLGDRFHVVRSWINGIEFQARQTGKGAALGRIKAALGDQVTLTVGVGNYENDIDLLEAADIGYAVGDAIPSVKAVADRITVDCAEHAIAEIIAELERERKNGLI